MVLILSIAGAAWAALRTYNSLKARDPDRAQTTVVSIRQTTSVVLAFSNAIFAVLDALQLIMPRPMLATATPAGRSVHVPVRFGQEAQDVRD